MVFPFGRKRAAEHRVVIERLHEDIVAAALDPGFYRNCGVPDTFQGRFEMLVLHAALVVRTLKAASAPGPVVAQDLVDKLFHGLDADLRELGVGDTSVPKRMKRFAEAFLGRAAAYDAALSAAPADAASAADAALAAALGRNVYDGAAPDPALVRYVRDAADRLAAEPLDACLAAPLRFPKIAPAVR